MIKLAVIDNELREIGKGFHKVESNGMLKQLQTEQFYNGMIDELNIHDKLVVMLHVRLRGKEGQNLIDQIKRRNVRICLLISPEGADVPASDSVMINASRILINNKSNNSLAKEIRKVMSDKVLVNPKVTRLVVDYINSPHVKGIESYKSLTNRQQEILHLIHLGKTNKEIALSLKICPETVRCHIKKLYRELQVASRKEARAKYSAITG